MRIRSKAPCLEPCVICGAVSEGGNFNLLSGPTCDSCFLDAPVVATQIARPSTSLISDLDVRLQGLERRVSRLEMEERTDGG